MGGLHVEIVIRWAHYRDDVDEQDGQGDAGDVVVEDGEELVRTEPPDPPSKVSLNFRICLVESLSASPQREAVVSNPDEQASPPVVGLPHTKFSSVV